ncbi:MAG TPA: VWA domain-containing protein, partial [Pirellulaceae bacterium]
MQRHAPMRQWLTCAVFLCWVPGVFADETSRLATFDADGVTSFALSVSTRLEPVVQAPHDVVILVDTSASQSGVFQDDSRVAAEEVVRGLALHDRCQLVAVDLDVVPLTTSWVSPRDPAIEQALRQLEDRTPLGTTDLVRGLDFAREQLQRSPHRRRVVYIGDGMSRINLLSDDEFRTLSATLVSKRIPVSSYALGPRRDVQFLAALANHTGGNVIVDQPHRTSQEAGATLAKVIHTEIFWPERSEFSSAFLTTYPGVFPPLRADRDSIVVGTLRRDRPLTLKAVGIVGEDSRTLQWSLTAEASNEDFATLPGLVELADRRGGACLPIAGSDGLRESLRVLNEQAQGLARMGRQSLRRKDFEEARRLSDAALRIDHGNPDASAIRDALK